MNHYTYGGTSDSVIHQILINLKAIIICFCAVPTYKRADTVPNMRKQLDFIISIIFIKSVIIDFVKLLCNKPVSKRRAKVWTDPTQKQS